MKDMNELYFSYDNVELHYQRLRISLAIHQDIYLTINSSLSVSTILEFRIIYFFVLRKIFLSS